MHDPEPTVGGIERFCLNLIPELQKKHDIFFCCLHQHRREPLTGVVMCKLPDTTPINSSKNKEVLHNFLLENNIDILLAHSYNPICENSILGTNVRLIYEHHSEPRALGLDAFDLLAEQRYNALQGGSIFPYLYSLLKFPISYLARNYRKGKHLKKMYDVCDQFVLLSPHFLSIFKRYAKIKKLDHASYISNPVKPIINTVDYTLKKKQILVVSRMELRAKRIDRILHIWKKLQSEFDDWELVIVGDGPRYHFFLDLAQKLNLKRVLFTGAQDPSDFYKESPILCLTSTHEGFGLVLVEAQQHGCVPVAFSSYASVRDIITHGKNGMLVRPFSIKQYVNTLRWLITHPNEREEMGRNGELSAQRFNPTSIAKQWDALFQRVMDTPKHKVSS
ncbi:MAG: glycosyltransferase [Akkermansia sp.]|nr:glycosyltransferase [Akkermansia sp.]